MRLLSLEVANYRNIAAAQLEPGRELTVICGNNGQGKTNLLEAIWLLTGGKSFRGGKDAELVRRGETFAVLEGRHPAHPAGGSGTGRPGKECAFTVGTPDAQRPGRYASVNGAPPKRAAGLAGSFPAVVFDPGHLSLVKGHRKDGGGFWTRRCASCTPATLPPTAAMCGHCSRKTRFCVILQAARSARGQKKMRPAGSAERGACSAGGEAIQKRRREYLALLAPLACANYAELSHGAERMAVHYAAQFEPGGLSAL